MNQKNAVETMSLDKSTWITSASAMLPMLEAGAHGDDETQLSHQILEQFHKHQLFRMLVPKEFGGGEVNIMTFSNVIEIIASGDGSAAWCLGQNAVCNMTSAYITREQAAKIFCDPRVVFAWGAGINGQAIETTDGFCVTGKWSFASGSRHATWLGGQSPIIGPDGKPKVDERGNELYRQFIFPKDACKITRNWDVVGLRGTGSDTYEVKDLIVPLEHAFLRSLPAPHPGILYRTPLAAVSPIAFASVALGLAGGIQKAFVTLAQKKTPQALKAMRENDAVLSILGHTSTRLSSARANLQSVLESICGQTLDTAKAIELRGATTFAIHEALAVSDTLYHEAGATAIHVGQPFERRLRDIHAVAQQVQARRSNFEYVGKYILGELRDFLLV